jgi:hypothetical protein
MRLRTLALLAIAVVGIAFGLVTGFGRGFDVRLP